MEKRSSLINLPKEAIIETANKAVRLAKVGLSVVAGLLGLALVMVVLSLAGPAIAGAKGGKDPSEVTTASSTYYITATANPVSICVGGYTSTITATVATDSTPVSDTFVIFTPTLGSITTNPYRYVEAESGSVTRSGTWDDVENASASGGKHLESETPGSKVSYIFNGTSIALIYTAGPEEGIANIKIDGGDSYSGTLDMYSTSAEWKTEELITTTLNAGTHTVEVEVSGNKNDSSTSFYILPDAFRSGTSTDGSGQASAIVTSGEMAGTEVITVTAQPVVDTVVSDSVAITYTAGPPDSVMVQAHPTAIPIAGYTSTITATVKDQYANLVDGTVVTFTADLGGFSVVGVGMKSAGAQAVTSTLDVTITAVSWVTRTTANGVATATLESGAVEGTATVTATADAKYGTVQVTFSSEVPGKPRRVTVTAYPISIPVSGSTSAITATVKDLYGGNVNDTTTVTFTTTTLGSISPLTNTTASGIATSTLTSEITAGIATVKATADSVWGTTNVTFTPGLPYTVTVGASPPSIPIGGYTSTITATITDEWNNEVKNGTVVTFTTDLGILGSNAIITKTTANGVATAILTSENVTGTATITATADSKAETTTVRFIEPTAYLPTIRKNYTDVWGNWDDGFQVQNLGIDTADIIILYYSRDGAVVSTQRDTIAADSSETYYTDTLEVGDNFDGSVVIASDQAVAVIANQYVSGSSMWASYTGVPNGALKVNVPLVMRGNSGWDTAISVQNTGLATATVELAFHPSPGLPGNSDTITDTIPPGAAGLFDQRIHFGLGPSFVGSAVVTSEEPVVAVVNETDGSILMSYSGFVGAGSTTVNVPLVMSQNSNWWTGVQVQNLGNFATDITITFYPDPAQSAITPTAQTVTGVASGASANFLQRGDQWTGKFVGSAVVTSSEPMVAIVNELNDFDGEGMSYGGFTSGTTKISAPLVMYDNNDWYTGLQVQNIGTSTATIDLKVDGVWRERVYVAPGSSYTWYPMPWAKVGAATVESLNGQPLVGIVNEITQPYKDGENSMSYECFKAQ